MAKQIPTEVTHSDYLAAMQPLYDLLGVTANEVYVRGFNVSPSDKHDGILDISLYVAARAIGDDADRPQGVHQAEGLQTSPQPHAELAWTVNVTVK